MDVAKLLDELEEIVYVIDPESYDLLYINHAGIQNLGRSGEDWHGKKCYAAIQGLDAPCPFCTNSILEQREPGAFYVWEDDNQHVNRHFILKDKFIYQEGRRLRMEIAFDVTEKENVSRRVREQLAVSQQLLDCIRALVKVERTEEGIGLVLSHLGDYYRADRVHLLQLQEDWTLRATYEWCARGVSSRLEQLRELPYAALFQRYSDLRGEEALELPDFSRWPKDGSLLPEDGGLLAVPLFSLDGTQFEGLIAVERPRTEADAPHFLECLAYFASEMVRRMVTTERMQQLRSQDILTGLNNRGRYTAQLDRYQEYRPNSLGVAFVDVNNFKSINERMGHFIGDVILRRIADVLRQYVPAESLYRISGDEFAVLWENCGHLEFLAALQAAEDELRLEETFSISLGASWAEQEVDTAALANRADKQLYLCKQDLYSNGAVQNFHHKSQMLDELLRAVQSNQFLVYLQPKCDAATGEVRGAEALVRYRREDGSIIPPNRFIPMLEKELIIKYVDFYMFEQVCRILQRWLADGGRAVPISMNFSRVTMMEQGFLQEVDAIWKRYQVPKQYLELEMTESVDPMGKETMVGLMDRIKSMGYRVSLDDFGTRYANLSLLAEMSADTLKIDKSLVDGVETHDRSRSLLDHVLRFCQNYGIQVVAEGVERSAQLDILKEMGCDEIQGYLFSRPVPEEEFAQRYGMGEPTQPAIGHAQ